MYFSKSKIIVIIDSIFATILHFKNKDLLYNHDLRANSTNDLLMLKKYVRQNQDAEVYIVYHPDEKDLEHHFLDIPKISDKELILKNIFSKTVLEQSSFSDLITLDKEKKHYLSLLGKIETDLLEFSDSIGKQFKGFGISALEYKSVIEVLSYGVSNVEEKARLDLLLISNLQKNTLRVVIYNNGVFFQEQVFNIPKCENLEIYTGYIIEKCNSIVSHLKAKVSNEAKVNTYFVLSPQIQTRLSSSEIYNATVIIVSPYELGIILGVEWLIEEDAEECEAVILGYNILRSGRVGCLFNTPIAIKKQRLSLLNGAIDCFALLLVLVFITYIFIINGQTYNLYFKYKGYINSENILQSEISQLLQHYYDFEEKQSINIDSANKALQVAYQLNDMETIYYIFNVHNNEDDVVNVEYTTFEDGRMPEIKIGINNSEVLQDRNKKQKPNIYAHIDYEEGLH